MGNRGAGVAEAVVPFAPKVNARSEAGKLATRLTQQAKRFWACFTKRPILPRQTIRRPWKWLTNCLLNFAPPKTE